MGWNRLCFARTRAACRVALAALALSALSAGTFAQTTATTNYTSLTNANLTLSVGSGSAVGGYISLATTSNNPTDPGQTILNAPAAVASNVIDTYGSRIYVRVNGGFDNRHQGGWDYTFGDNPGATITALTTPADWIVPPVVVGNNLIAKWETLPFLYNTALLYDPELPPGGTSTATGGGNGGTGGGGTGGGGTGTTGSGYINNQIEVDMTATIIRDVVRFQFDLKNLSPGTTTTVGLFFAQDLNLEPSLTAATADGPIRIPGQPYLHNEQLLLGSQVPQYWDSFDTLATAVLPQLPTIHSVRGTLKPQNTTETQPTPPTRFLYGDSSRVNLYNWTFQPDPTIYLDRASSLGVVDSAVGLVWDETAVTAGQTKTIVTFIGQSNSDSDYSPSMTLSVYGINAMGFVVDKVNGVGSPQPNPFTVSATIHNLTDVIQGTGGLNLGPVNVFLQLPTGLSIVDTNATPNPVTVSSLAAGSESTTTWQIKSDGTTSGTLTYTVTATPKFGTGKVVQRTIQIPAPATLSLKGPVAVGTGGTTLNLPTMVSIPFQTGSALPSAVLGLTPPNPNDTPLFNLVRYDPTQPAFPLPYVPVNQFTLGYAYWISSNLATSRSITINPALYPPLPNQTSQPPATFTVAYPAGWNQIGNPYVYAIPFSEINVFDTETQQLIGLTDAASSQYGWINPAVYHYNTVDPNPVNWGYELYDSLGFMMQPYDGYWVYINKPTLQFIYSGVDTPYANILTVSKSLGLGTQLGRTTSNNWRLKLHTKGIGNTDAATYIGVAPGASDSFDIYKYPKPPLVGRQTTLEIVHSDWAKENGRYAQDLRSPSMTTKTWNLLVRSTNPKDNVTVSWPDIAASVPRGLKLTLINSTDNSQHDLRTTASYTVQTGADSTRSLQIVAEPMQASHVSRISSFDVVASKGSSRATVRSVTINYTLTTPADAQIAIRDGGGRTVRTITTTTRAINANSNTGTAVWDMKDQNGAVLAGGVYSLELTIIGADGQRSRQTRPFLISR